MRTRLLHTHRSRRLLLGVGLAAAVLTVGGPASAFWAAYGPGDGTAGTQSPAAVTLSPGTPTTQLYPGGSADVVLSIANPNSASVHLGSLALDPTQGAGGFATDAEHPACSPASLSFTTATNAGMGWTVPGADGGSDGSLPATLAGALSMGIDADDACQGAHFTIFLTAGP
jgi:hypothetical protein